MASLAVCRHGFGVTVALRVQQHSQPKATRPLPRGPMPGQGWDDPAKARNMQTRSATEMRKVGVEELDFLETSPNSIVFA